MNCAQRKQYVQYAWHVCAAAAKKRTVSAYLCCTPVNSAFLGALSVFWPAGWGFRASRMTSTVAFMALGSLQSPVKPNRCVQGVPCRGHMFLHGGHVRVPV